MKIIMIMIIAGIVVTACKKDEATTEPAVQTVDLEFVIEQTDFGGLKSGNASVPQCSELPMHYVKFKLGGVPYFSEIINMPDGQMLTKAVKLTSGQSYSLSEFLVYSDVLPVGEGPEDLLVRAAPADGSVYNDLMVNKLDLDVVFEDFVKKQVVVDVLCFEELFYTEFGFNWFELNDVKIERMCFFGDVCTGKPGDFGVTGSMYLNQMNGVQMDMPAIMQLKVFKKVDGDWGDPIRVFDNDLHADGTDWYGEGACMEIYWANDLDKDEDFRFELYVHLPYGAAMDWMLVDFWEFQNGDFPESIGDDGVFDYVLGNCSMPDADKVYPAYMNLPKFTESFTMTIKPRTLGTYVDAVFAGIPGDFDIDNGLIGVWCGDKDNVIYYNTPYTVRAISSIHPFPAAFTSSNLTPQKLHALNWLWNHLPDYFDGINMFDMKDYSGAGYDASDYNTIQNAVWAITNGFGVSGDAETMRAASMLHLDFKPLPGQWAAVLFWVNERTQVMFVQVDP